MEMFESFRENCRKIDNFNENEGKISYFRENEKRHFSFNLIRDAEPDNVDCPSGGLLLI
jgi:hypothetical protein